MRVFNFGCGGNRRGHFREEDQSMKTIRKYPFFYVLALLGLILMASPGAFAQLLTSTSSTGSIANSPQDGDNDADDNFNPPPCDFTDAFYTKNGIDVKHLDTSAAGRFGLFRLNGPPATGTQVNWVNDSTCSAKDPTRTNVRILATTGGYVDDGTGAPTDFISIIAFLLNQNFFTGVANARNIQMVDIVSDFEAYAALKQTLSDGSFALTPCGTMGTGAKPCFPVTSVATPNLRQDWRFATNRNAIDGSDGNDPLGVPPHNSPFGYFCDDILGMWVITYFWFTVNPANPGPVCGPILSNLAKKNGLSLDGTPIIKTADELNNQLEANGCGAEGQEDVGGADGGAVWLVCPAIPDPRAGAIAKDAFLDSVHLSNGAPLDPAFTQNFTCLQTTGTFPASNGSCQAIASSD
ncbi:MAG TPA: hypothetical protein VK138_04280 [Acidiferrobacterales bacterium]|nr:hypothetical protein [Acidiferrobacterales bacterium]